MNHVSEKDLRKHTFKFGQCVLVEGASRNNEATLI